MWGKSTSHWWISLTQGQWYSVMAYPWGQCTLWVQFLIHVPLLLLQCCKQYGIIQDRIIARFVGLTNNNVEHKGLTMESSTYLYLVSNWENLRPICFCLVWYSNTTIVIPVTSTSHYPKTLLHTGVVYIYIYIYINIYMFKLMRYV